jgi:predicted aspartyl protease
MVSTIVSAQLTGLDLLEGKSAKKLKFRFVQGFLIVEVKYANIFPLKFIFDTGAQNTIIFDRLTADLGNLQYGKQIFIMGSDLSDRISARVGRNAIIGLENMPNVKKDVIVLDNDLLQIQEIIGESVHGILGADFLKGLVVNIDFKQSVITFHNSSKFKYNKLRDYTKITSKFIEGKPYVDGAVSIDGTDSIPIKLLIDTGASISLMLHSNTHPSLILPEKSVRGNLGKGLGGEVSGFVGKINKLTIDKFHFDTPISFFQEYNRIKIDSSLAIIRNGIIGNFILDRFSIYIDYVKSEFYLKPIKKYNRAFKYDKSGLSIFAHGVNLKEFIINDVIEGSPAFEAGIKPKDIITHVGFYSNESMTLEILTNRLSGKTGKKISMKIKRGDKTLKFKFKLRPLF